MFLELDRAEEALLVKLVNARICMLDHERGDGNGHARPAGVWNPGYEDEMVHERELLERLLHRLHEAEFDVTC